MATLYRKYRPQTFDEVIGQNHIKITLQHELERGEIGHAYLFCGPRGLGKTTLARLFAKAVNCQNRQSDQSEPCNKCASCLDIMAGRNIDIIEIDAASHTGVDNVRENIIENSRFTPSQVQYKVFIIDEVHMLSTAAFNALLKTLEEPPAHAIFILCTTEVHKLLPTIISRCQRFDVKKVSSADLFKRLKHIVKAEKKKVDDEALKNVILNSDGCIRDAESLLGKILTLGDNITLEQAEIILPRSDFSRVAGFLNFLAEKNTTASIELINTLVEEGVDLQVFTDNLIEFLRKILLLRINGSLSGLGIELAEEAEQAAARLAEKFGYEELLALLELFIAKRLELKSALIQQLPLEMAAVAVTVGGVKKESSDREDDFSDHQGNGPSVKEKIKDKLSQLNPRKAKSEEKIPLSQVSLEKGEGEIKVDLLSKQDKLKPSSFVDFDKVRENWQLILENILAKNYTLAALLKISEPLKCRDNCLEIAVRSNFYRERLSDISSSKIISEAFSEVLLAEVTFRPVVKDEVKPWEVVFAEEEPITTPVASDPVAPPAVAPAKSADVVQEVMSMF